MKQFSLTLLIATFFCLVTFSFAQESKIQTKNAKPIRIDKLPTEKIPVPNDISVLEAKSYEFLIAPSGKISVNLYNIVNKHLVKVEVEESILDKTLFYKITENNREEWLKIQTQERQNSILFFATTSAGTEMSLEAQIERTKNSGKFRVKEIILSTEAGLKTLSLNETNLTESRLAIENAVQNQEQKIFATPSLQKLKEFMRGFGRLKDTALSKWSGQEKISADCNKVQENPTNNIEIEEPAMEEPVGGGCGGEATCWRISTLVPVFSCIPSSGNCSGVFILYDCITNIRCTQSCAALNNCA